MKTVFAKSLVVVAGVALFALLATSSLLVGAQAAAGVESTEHRLLLTALALSGALVGGAKGLRRDEDGAWEGKSPRVNRRDNLIGPTSS